MPVTPLAVAGLDAWTAGAEPRAAAWVQATGFEAKPGQHTLVPDDRGGIARVLLGVERDGQIGLWEFAGLPGGLPAGRYAVDAPIEPADATRAALGRSEEHTSELQSLMRISYS